MAQESKRLDLTPTWIEFSNGTNLEGLGGTGSVRQRLPDPGRLRLAALPSEPDTSAGSERALAELGIREQETIDLDASTVLTGADDSLTLAPALVADDRAPCVVLSQDESGGISWHFVQAAASATRTACAPRAALRHSLTPSLTCAVPRRCFLAGANPVR